jgi:hypothetical protein
MLIARDRVRRGYQLGNRPVPLRYQPFGEVTAVRVTCAGQGGKHGPDRVDLPHQLASGFTAQPPFLLGNLQRVQQVDRDANGR